MTISELKARLVGIINRPRYAASYDGANVADAIQDRARVEAIALILKYGMESKAKIDSAKP